MTPNEMFLIKNANGSVATACLTKEDADLLAIRLHAANFPQRYYVERLALSRGDLQPLQYLYIEATVTDGGEVFIRTDKQRLSWPFEVEHISEAAWEWQRNEEEEHGILYVRGLSPSRVRGVFKTVSEMFRTDEALRSKKSPKG